MSWLVAAVAALSVLTAFNTVLCFGLIRRLRLAGGNTAAPAPDLDVPAVGHVIGPFVTIDDAGALLTYEELASALVLFLSPGCGPCADVARSLDAAGDRLGEIVVAFVLGEPDDDDAARFAAALPPSVRRAFVRDGDAVTTAFGGIRGYPTLVRLEHGVVRARGLTLAEVVASPHRAVASRG